MLAGPWAWLALLAVASLSAPLASALTVAAQREQAAILFAGVYTAPTEEARLRRREIRETYWRHPLLKSGGPVVAKFVVGYTESQDDAALALREEFEKYPNDFLHLDVKESYSNLTVKTMAFLRWFAVKARADFILKLDDDTFPHFGFIVDYLRTATETYLHMGMMFNCAPVLKETKWAENPLIWNHSFFPRYMQGSGYFLSAPLVLEIVGPLRVQRNLASMLNNEDAAVGVWIERSRWDDPNLEIIQRNIPTTLSGCQPGDLLSMNNQIGYMSCYWRRYLRGENDPCCYGPLDHLQQSLLQVGSQTRQEARQAARAHVAEVNAEEAEEAPQVACYGDW